MVDSLFITSLLKKKKKKKKDFFMIKIFIYNLFLTFEVK